MRNRKSNRLKGYDYSKDNLYFITNCVKNNLCCFGNVIHVGTGRDLSVHCAESNYPEIHHPKSNDSEIHHSESNDSEINNPEIHYPKSNYSESNYPENHHSESNDSEINHPEIHYPKSNDSEIHHSEINNPKIHHSESHHPEIRNSKIRNPDLDYIMELNQYGLIVEERINWLMSQYMYVDIHNYVVMPNHFHLILEIDSLRVKGQDIKIKSVSSLMGAMKTTSSNLIHDAGFEDFAWHRSFHDHIIRNEFEYNRISNYIDLNPQKWLQDTFFENK